LSEIVTLKDADHPWLFISFSVDEKKRTKEKFCPNNAVNALAHRTPAVLTSLCVKKVYHPELVSGSAQIANRC
jgi:hypothetical protein